VTVEEEACVRVNIGEEEHKVNFFN